MGKSGKKGLPSSPSPSISSPSPSSSGFGVNGDDLAEARLKRKQAEKEAEAEKRYYSDLELNTSSGQAFLLKFGILGMIYILAFIIRLFSVVRYESIIHEFDPWFNFRTTQHIVSEGFMDFLNWFDDRSWYPLGRHIGGTIYPGLMATAAFVHYVMNALNLTIDIRNVCVLIGPFFASNTAIVAYLISKDIHDEGVGLFSAAFVAIVPGFISRSVAGSYDNEAVAIFALLITFYFWVRAVNTGSMLWACATAIGYFYMVAAWGGYIYITNLLPLYTLVMVLFGRFSHRLYIAYSVSYVLGTLLSMQVFIVEFKPVRTGEHMPALGVFCLLQIYGFLQFAQSKISSRDYKSFKRLALLALIVLGLIFTVISAYAFQWTGRLYSLFNLNHAKAFVPILSSVAEHQPSLWDSLFFDTHMLLFLVPCGLYWCFRRPSDGSIFLILYALSSLYFASAMVRLVLVVSPILCLLGGVAFSFTLRRFMSLAKRHIDDSADVVLVFVAAITLLLFTYSAHSTYVASEAYSSPSIVLQAKQHDNSKIIFDDFREAYRWLSQNTGDDEIVMSWWDYGYQISGMGNRTVLVDGNTRNNTHIALVGRMMAASEERAYELAQDLDVNYVLVIFGGVVGYQSDDINKFLWMVRISGNLFPEIEEKNYLTPEGQYRIDSVASKTMTNSLMYKLCYYRFGEVGAEYGRPGFDRVRNAEIADKKVTLKYFEEAYTTQHWLVRLYRVKKPSNLA